MAIHTTNEVLIYKYNIAPQSDAELMQYVCTFKNLHYDFITDAAWVSAEQLLVSSRDGFISVLNFDLKDDFKEESRDDLGPVKMRDFTEKI